LEEIQYVLFLFQFSDIYLYLFNCKYMYYIFMQLVFNRFLFITYLASDIAVSY